MLVRPTSIKYENLKSVNVCEMVSIKLEHMTIFLYQKVGKSDQRLVFQELLKVRPQSSKYENLKLRLKENSRIYNLIEFQFGILPT